MSEPFWEMVEPGPTETYLAQVPGGWLYRTVEYEHRGEGDWQPACSALVFVPDEEA